MLKGTSNSTAVGLFLRLFGNHPAHCAMLDLNANIVAVNQAWMNFGLNNGLADGYSFEEQNYLTVCERAVSEGSAYADQALAGFLAILSAGQGSFSMNYPCHSPDEHRWFTLSAQSQLPASRSIVVAHTYLGREADTERHSASAPN